MTALTHPPHPVATAVASARTALDDVADAPVWSMDAAQTTQALCALAAHEAQTAALKARLLVHAEAVEANQAQSLPSWLAHRHRLTRREAHRQSRVAKALDAHPLTATALTQARINGEQAEAILRGLDTLPADLEPDLVVEAEEHLLELAKDFDAKSLRNLARSILEVVAPEVADEHLAKQLEKEERDAAAAARFSMWEDSHGKVHGKFTLDAFSGACLKKALLALAAPKHRASKAPLGDRLPTPERLGQAFMEYVQRYPTQKLPKAGGLNATVVVLMELETLMDGLKAAKLDTGETISPALSRRLACEAGIIPAVLGGKSEVLDLGRSRRFHSKPQRIVATIEHGGCDAEGCDAPPGMTQMHHVVPWSEGGETNTRDVLMLCPPDHRRIHDPRYSTTRLPSGQVRFIMRT